MAVIKRVGQIRHMKTVFRKGLNQSATGVLGAKLRFIHRPGGKR